MAHTISRLNVFFENPFWVGVYERQCEGRLEAAKVVFGPEPKDYEVYGYFLKHWDTLRFSPPVESTQEQEHRVSPKRQQRAIHREISAPSTGTKAQQALSLQREQQKQERRVNRRMKKEEEKELRYALRQQRKKQKHRGR